MKLQLYLTIFFLGVIPCSLQAHEGHSDQLGLEEIIEEGKIEINRLVDKKLIADSWKQSAEFNYDASGGLVEINGKRRWVIAYSNSFEPDIAKQTMMIILTPSGKFVGYEFIQ